jgi:broad specificity phosphatase PhoE
MRPILACNIGLALACATALAAAAHAQDRTVILVRHAERAAEPRADPPLSDAGRTRAAALARALESAGVGSAIVTQYRRTRETAEPVLRPRGLAPIVAEVAGGLAAHVQAVAQAVGARPAGETVLVVGHSNTIPAIIAALGGPALPNLCEAEYASLFILTLPAAGSPRLVRGTYGAPDPPGADACGAAAPPGMLDTMPRMPDSARYGRRNP